ncbi:MAG: hypothetical protein KDD48_08410 [Bdellovibrionales bacterium]|nr:hypothetical protein [Bdellovibrionales bacterium]
MGKKLWILASCVCTGISILAAVIFLAVPRAMVPSTTSYPPKLVALVRPLLGDSLCSFQIVRHYRQNQSSSGMLWLHLKNFVATRYVNMFWNKLDRVRTCLDLLHHPRSQFPIGFYPTAQITYTNSVEQLNAAQILTVLSMWSSSRQNPWCHPDRVINLIRVYSKKLPYETQKELEQVTTQDIQLNLQPSPIKCTESG